MRIGKNTAVQDTAVVEGSGSKPVALGNNVTVGQSHRCSLCFVRDFRALHPSFPIAGQPLAPWSCLPLWRTAP